MPLLEMTTSSLRPSTRSLSVSRTLGLQKSVVLLVGTALFCAAAPRVVPQDWNGSVTSFVIIDNTAGSPINDVFSNLVDNSTFTSNGNTYRVSYEGGTGNDLTLGVIPEPSAIALIFLGVGVLLTRPNASRLTGGQRL
jgi:hypothetical protein